MRVLLSWLRELVDLPAEAAEIAARLTMAGIEVESISRLDAGLEKVVVGEVRSRDTIAGTHLSVCRVFDGESEFQVVCGAQNYGVGARVPFARVGAVLPGGKAIGQAKLRGVESFGMLCSGAELGADDGVDGLLLLSPGTAPGTPIADVLGRNDWALEANITPNRGDALSHVGIARDVAALYALPLRQPIPEVPEGTGPSPATIEITEADRCSRFCARVISGVKVGPSPAWLAHRLEALGQRSINNIVDATNFVLFELGQPLHAYDFDRVSQSRLVARQAAEGEKLKTLDGKERDLSTDDLVIADGERPVGLAGVMGGEESEVRAGTTRLLLESACFSPASVRRTARRHSLHSDASQRFERGVDPEGTRRALDRLTEVVLQVAGGEVVGKAVDTVARPYDRARILLRRARIDELLGIRTPWLEALEILRALGLDKVRADVNEAEFDVPGYRSDLNIEEDLIDEVARIRGFESIPGRLPGASLADARETPSNAAEVRLRGALSAAGFDEAVNYAFVAPPDLAHVRPEVKPILLRNPLTPDRSAMRTTLLPGLLRNVQHNLRHGVPSIRLYEVGRVYLPLSGAPEVRMGEAHFVVDREPRRLALIAAGARNRSWTGGREPIDFYDLKGAIEQVVESLGLARPEELTWAEATGIGWLHPRSATSVVHGGVSLGAFGEIHPSVAEAFDLPRGIVLAELDFDSLVERARMIPPYKGIPKFPASLRDVAIVVDEKVTIAEVLAELHRTDSERLVEEALVFDVYRGEPIAAGKKNLAFSMRIRSPARTLTDDEVNKLHADIVARLSTVFGAELRA